MLITGIEVIRGSPGIRALRHRARQVTGVPVGEKVELTYGDALRINTGFDYRGPAQDVSLYGSIGERKVLIGFDEKVSAEVTVSLPHSLAEFVPVTASLDIPITADIGPGTDYDIYCKIKEYMEAGLPEVDDVIDITGIPPTYELLQETIYPYAYVYDGPDEVSVFTCTSDPFIPADWLAAKFAAAAESEVEKAGGRVMEVRVYVDKSPLFWTDWRIEIVGTPLAGTAGLSMTLGIPIWAAILIACLAICAVMVIATWAIKTIVGTFTHKPISEEIKLAWSKETLIKVIYDFEIKLERSPTPPEELEEWSEEELRVYTNELAAVVAPPAEGLGLAIVAAGVLGLGALAVGAYALSRPKKAVK